MRQVRAKFRCLAVSHKWNHEIVAEFGPVLNKKGDHYEENKTFWEFTPTGELELSYFHECPIEPGAYYYLDLVESDGENPWTLNMLSLHEGGRGDVQLSWYRNMPDGWDYKQPYPAGLHRGQFEMTIEGSRTRALETFGKPGTKWELTVTLAEPSDD